MTIYIVMQLRSGAGFAVQDSAGQERHLSFPDTVAGLLVAYTTREAAEAAHPGWAVLEAETEVKAT